MPVEQLRELDDRRSKPKTLDRATCLAPTKLEPAATSCRDHFRGVSNTGQKY